MLKFKVKVRRNDLPRIAKMLPKEIAEINEGAGRLGVRVAKQRVPVLTGALQGSIHMEGKGLDIKIVADRDYDAVIEYGGVNRPAQPYMRPAALAAQIYMQKELSRLAGRLG